MKNFCKYLLSFIFCLSSFVNADIPRSMYVLNGSAETVSKMVIETGEVQQNVALTGQVPNRLVVHQDMIYVLDSGTSDIKMINPMTDEVVRTIALKPGANPYDMAFVGQGKLYVSNWIANTISIVDVESGTITGEIATGKGPEGVLLVNNDAFVANTGYAGWGVPYEQGAVSVIDILADTVKHSVEVPTNPQKIVLASDGRLHVLCTGDYAENLGKVAVIDLYTGPLYDTPAVVNIIDIGGAPGDLVITPSGKAYCIAWGDGAHGFLYSYDASNGEVFHNADDPILVGPNTGQLVYDARERCLWIPYMKMWGGDGHVQKYDIENDTVVWTSNVLGAGTQFVAILEKIWQPTPWADAVVSFTPGSDAGFGANYFPNNILGPPDQAAGLSEYSSSNKPQEVLSLGTGGEIVLSFDDNYIVDGTGADFTVFENVFISFLDNQPFVEAGIVAVSQDGKNFVEFPYDTATWAGLAGVTPTKDNFNFIDPVVSGGDKFDLADVGLDWARYVKITDLGDIKKEGAWNGDFDLDAIVAIHYEAGMPASVNEESITAEQFELVQNYPNPFNPQTTISFSLEADAETTVQVFNVNGQLVKTLAQSTLSEGRHNVVWNGTDETGANVGSGVYLARLTVGDRVKMIKMSLIR
jgi:YVTN family beta-propeller protein